MRWWVGQASGQDKWVDTKTELDEENERLATMAEHSILLPQPPPRYIHEVDESLYALMDFASALEDLHPDVCKELILLARELLVSPNDRIRKEQQ